MMRLRIAVAFVTLRYSVHVTALSLSSITHESMTKTDSYLHSGKRKQYSRAHLHLETRAPSESPSESGVKMVKQQFEEDAPHWLDTDGNRIEAHGGGFLQNPEGRWFWYGESRKGDVSSEAGVNAYSADSLSGPWKSHGAIFDSSSIDYPGFEKPYIIERPKVIYNKNTQKYVMWVHVDHQRSKDFVTMLRKPSASTDECTTYATSTTCAWTTNYSCPLQRPGAKGTAGADGSIGYQCCCDLKLWQQVRSDECTAYTDTAKCSWTSKYSCPGQKAGTVAEAEDDSSVDYQCCCDQGYWNESKADAVRQDQILMQIQQKEVVEEKEEDVYGEPPERSLGVDEYVSLLSAARSEVRQTLRERMKVTAALRVIRAAKALRARKRQRFGDKMRRATEYIMRRVAVATSDTPEGPFKLEHILAPDGVPSLDLNLYIDNDGSAYFVRSCDNAYTGISRLTDDYLNTSGMLSKGPRVEGMAMFRHPVTDKLYMMTSHLTGWNPNPLMLYRSDGPDLSDPQWVDLGNPTNDETSFNTQPTSIVMYTTQAGQTYPIYMADNWIYGGRQGLLDATYVWLPIRFDGDEAHIDKMEEWDLENPFANVPTPAPMTAKEEMQKTFHVHVGKPMSMRRNHYTHKLHLHKNKKHHASAVRTAIAKGKVNFDSEARSLADALLPAWALAESDI